MKSHLNILFFESVSPRTPLLFIICKLLNIDIVTKHINTHHTLQQRPRSTLKQSEPHEDLNDFGDDVHGSEKHAHHLLGALVRLHQEEDPRLDGEQRTVQLGDRLGEQVYLALQYPCRSLFD